ncbi:signal peptidase I [Patescibacteria group bacterium]|nr:signal peptidase I [Patescibacteria group bacterium]
MRNIALYFLIAGIIILAFFAASPSLPVTGKYKFFTVNSGSMSPKIPKGSLILDKEEKNYSIGDVITARIPGNKFTVTHRIVETGMQGSSEYYRVKGDANDAPDQDLIFRSYVIGKVIFSVPLLGFPVSFAQTLTGLIILIVIPGTVIVYSELLNIKNEVKRLIQEKRNEKDSN